MAASKAWVVSGIVLAALFRCSGLEAAALIVDLRVQADVPPRTVRAAKDAAVAVFRDIGVTVRWTNEDSPDEHGLSLPWRRIAVIDQPTPAYSAAQADDHVLGVSPRALDEPGRVGVIFYERVLRTSRETRVRSGWLLGYAIAHEIAHLLLPAGHAETGVMRASWSRSDLHGITTRVLAFDRPCAALIRDRLLTERDSRR
jgi:hypothetical protein